MKTCSIAFALMISLALSSVVQAAGFARSSIYRTQLRAQKGVCALPDDREIQKKICALAGDPKVNPSSVRVIAGQGGINFKLAGRTVLVKTGKIPAEIHVNGHSLRTNEFATLEDFQKQLLLALQPRQSALNLLVPMAFAATEDVYASTLVAQLVTESQEIGACAIYRDFGLRCAKAMGHALNQISGEGGPSAKRSGIRWLTGRYNEKADLLFLNSDLMKIRKSVKDTMIPALNAHDLARTCAGEGTGGFPALQPLAALENLQKCERMVGEVAKLSNSYEEKDAPKVMELKTEIAQMTGSVLTQNPPAAAPAGDGIQ